MIHVSLSKDFLQKSGIYLLCKFFLWFHQLCIGFSPFFSGMHCNVIMTYDRQTPQIFRYTGIFDCYRKTIEHHGLRGLYRGWPVAVLSPKAVVRFQAFEHLKKLNLDETGHLSAHGKFLCGMAAGALEAALAVTPIESIKVKFIHDSNFATQKYEGLVQGVSRIIRKQGTSFCVMSMIAVCINWKRYISIAVSTSVVHNSVFAKFDVDENL